MADNYIDNQETLSYGDFAAGQILALLVGLDPGLDSALKLAAQRISDATDTMRSALKKAGDIELVTYKPTDGAPDPVTHARSLLRRLVNYAASREEGDTIVDNILAGATLGTVLKRRPAKLAGALGHAVNAVTKHKTKLPEHAKWSKDLSAAKDTLDELNTNVRQSRAQRRDATPEVAAARVAWFKAYGSAKLIAEGVLRYQDKTSLLPDVFDDLAEVHRAPGVTDDEAPPPPASVPATPATPG